MGWERNFVRKHTLETAGIFLIGCLSTFFFCDDCHTAIASRWPVFIYLGFLWAILWKGNEWVSQFPDKYISWLERPLARMVTGLIAHILFTVLAVTVLQVIVALLTKDQVDHFSFQTILEYSLPSVVITLAIVIFMTAVRFFYAWRNLAVRHEKLKTEAMAFKYAALKNQVNPHFLFNSLNVLTSLVYKDADQSAQFIRKLAEVYRYVLDTQEKEWVPLREEMEFVHSFIFLQKIRFGEHLDLIAKISNPSHFRIVPMSLQILVENAIKHNIITEEHPLTISIYQEGQHLVVANKRTPKSVMASKEGIGLRNLDSRYQFLTSNRIQVVENNQMFTVKIPLIPV